MRIQVQVSEAESVTTSDNKLDRKHQGLTNMTAGSDQVMASLLVA